MTEVSKMTDQQLNRALAELMGYHVATFGGTPKYHRLLGSAGEFIGKTDSDIRKVWNQAPSYCTDPAASLEVQAAAVAKDGIRYLHNLSDVVEPDEVAFQQDGEMIAYTLEHTVQLITATPRQRAEAAYMTLSSDRT